MKLVFYFAYSGENYHGFQKQPRIPTIQSELEKALVRLFPKLTHSGKLNTYGAGRTDVGVHSSEQVLAVPINPPTLAQIRKITLTKLPQVLNTLLPPNIRVLNSFLTGKSDKDFNPRYRAKVRCYRYRIISAPKKGRGSEGVSYISDRIEELASYHVVPFALDIDKLWSYFNVLEGRHDFTSFASWDSRDIGLRQAVRVIYRIDLIPKGREVLIDIYGGSFLKAMVRSIIGNVLHHYQKGNSPQLIRDILHARDPSYAKHRVPSRALFLRRVFFTPIFGSKKKIKTD